VVVDAEADTAPRVTSDDESGAQAAAAHLLAAGHRDILVVTFISPVPEQPENLLNGVSARRVIGHERAFAALDLTLPLDSIVRAPPTMEGGAAAFATAWQAGQRPTAALVHSDVMAFGVIAEARRLGLDIPGDLEVIGFDDVLIAALICPPLSTVHQPIVEKGQVAAELLVAALQDRATIKHVLLPTHLVLRGSTR